MSASTRPGMVVGGRYELLEPAGRGGSASVWRARDAADGAAVALKWFPRGGARAQRWEVGVLRRVQGDGIARLRDQGRHGGHEFLVTEFVEGEPFGHGAPRAWAEVEPLARAALRALARVHREGFVHCDLKPSNVLVRDGRPVVIDFGAARRCGRLRSAPEGRSATADYMAPELWAGDVTPQGDLYSLAAMLHRALTGRLPYRATGSLERRLDARAAAPPRTRWSLCPGGCPAHVAAALERALAPSPRDRFASAEALLDALRDARTAPSVPPGGAPFTEDELRARFEGPDVFLHLPEDAARLLFARTHGDRRAVDLELRAWERTGFARPSGPRVAVCRDDLDLAATDDVPCELLPPRPLPPSAFASLPDASRECAHWLSLRCAPCPAALLAVVSGLAPEAVASGLAALAAAGLARADGAGAFVLTGAPPPPWSAARRREAHARFAAASAPDAPGRLHHVIAGDAPAAALAAQLVDAASRAARAGRVGPAREVLAVGLRALLERGDVGAGDVAAPLALWLRVALEQWTPSAVDAFAWAVSDARGRVGPLPAYEALARAAQARLKRPREAAALLRDLAVDGGGELAMLRREIRLHALRGDVPARREELAAAARAAPATAEWARFLDGWRGQLAHDEGRFREAMDAHLRAAEGEAWPTRSLRARLNAAAAALEAGALGEAARWSAAAREEASALRLPAIEARACYLERVARWRRGDDAPGDLALAEAARGVDPLVTLLLAFHDAARAWRARDVGAFRAAREAAAAAEGHAARPAARALLDGMAVDLGAAAMGAAAREEALAAAERAHPRIALQVAALTRAERARGEEAQWSRYAASVPSEHWGLRLDVMSVRECLDLLG
ncbi:MAG: serine/threonine-protein kinase [Polyangiales bacterium]